MDYSFFDFLTLIGSLGLFLYGMKVMSEGLQKVAGNKLRSILTAMTSNRVMGVFTGLFITALIQSSSATTVMVVSFVNAGLLSLAQSITVIMGANIGTTVTAWIVSFFGFKVSISVYAIPLIGLSLPLIFSKKNKRVSWGEFILGFAFLFMGLDFLKDSVPDIKSNPEILAFLSQYVDMGYGSVFLFLLVGTILTVVVQSSSASMAITLVMVAEGWISYEIAAAIVMGENIGTTITANLAALTANLNAKRSAFAHFMFNIFGVCWLLLLFYPFTRFITTLGNSLGIENDQMLLSLFHTTFNVINVCLMIWFVKGYEYIVTKVIRGKKAAEEEDFQLQFIQTGLLSTSELSLIQAKQEIALFGKRTHRMFGIAMDFLKMKKDSEEFNKTYSRLQKYEQISDNTEMEIADYLNHVNAGKLSEKGKLSVTSKLNIISEIESVSDSIFHIARSIRRKQKLDIEFNDFINEKIESMFVIVNEAIENSNKILSANGYTEADIENAMRLELEINQLRNQIRNDNVKYLNDKKYDYQTGVVFMDIILECERLGDYLVNIVEAEVNRRKEMLKLN